VQKKTIKEGSQVVKKVYEDITRQVVSSRMQENTVEVYN